MIHDRMENNSSHAGRNPAESSMSSNQRPENVFEEVHASDDAFQFIGSTNRHTTTAKSVSAKLRTTQCLGDISDLTIQQISNNRRVSTITPAAQVLSAAQIEQSHGQGRKLGRTI
ncbi:hypothetical protein BDW59DRAFT_144302 [Aspergillus cavernicola]|uniref:Uncharacterized protein n=1 Tax=Aspergillus cavernicola TaxID=176166 RepID=A0ABR4IH96_9EURO